MSLLSMTGFGRGEASQGGVKIDVEFSSVNRKQFDIYLNIPRDLVALESKIHAMVHKHIRRGHIKGVVRVSLSGEVQQGRVLVDAELARGYLERLRSVAGDLLLDDNIKAADLLRLPEVVSLQSANARNTSIWPLMRKAVNSALIALVDMRAKEGASLERELLRRFKKLSSPVAQIRKRAPRIPRMYEQALLKRLARIEVPIADDDPALRRELALFADRCDISEELTRLDSHFKQVSSIIASNEPCGRSLDFLCQEMFREINTVGSKANDSTIAKYVIKFKAELEAAREQVQNVE